MKPGQPIESPEAPFILPARYRVRWSKVIAMSILVIFLLAIAWALSSIIFFHLVKWLFGTSGVLPETKVYSVFSNPQERMAFVAMFLISLVGIAKMALRRRQK